MRRIMPEVIVATVIIGIFFLLSSCGVFISSERAANAVEKQGYGNVEIISKHIFFTGWRGCGRDDVAAFDALATNALGQRVELIICAGFPFKGVTVRTR